MNERHEKQLKVAHQLYDNRDLKQELMWQREFLDTGYLSYQQVCFNKWIFDECLKLLEEHKVGKWRVHDYAEIRDGLIIPNYECTCCHDWIENDSDYCPNCGAEMVGVENG